KKRIAHLPHAHRAYMLSPIESAIYKNGGRGIRTPGRVSPSTVFKTAALNHSAIPPLTILSETARLLAGAYFASSTGTSSPGPPANIFAESKKPAVVKWNVTAL